MHISRQKTTSDCIWVKLAVCKWCSCQLTWTQLFFSPPFTCPICKAIIFSISILIMSKSSFGSFLSSCRSHKNEINKQCGNSVIFLTNLFDKRIHVWICQSRVRGHQHALLYLILPTSALLISAIEMTAQYLQQGRPNYSPGAICGPWHDQKLYIMLKLTFEVGYKVKVGSARRLYCITFICSE